jgi:putative membrane protein
VQRGTTEDIRNLGKMVTTDHEAVRQMGRDLAKKLNIPLKTDAGAGDYAQTLQMLESKSGTDFDRAYLAHELKFHQSVIDAIKTSLLPAIRNPEFAELVRKVLPGFEHHLAATKVVAKKFGME